jgi:hypothetical protein
LILLESARSTDIFKLAEMSSSPVLLSEQVVGQIRQAIDLDGTEFVEAGRV